VRAYIDVVHIVRSDDEINWNLTPNIWPFGRARLMAAIKKALR